jgi:2,5-dichlorohydroquinone reductive dechlorinase
MPQDTASIVDKLNADLASRRPPSLIGGAPGVKPRYTLYHAPNSICSQKVRVVLAAKGVPYESRTLNLFEGETYLPDYVRLRVKGCDDAGLALAARHSGSTSATAQGCDACVVPTLYDRENGQVIVDSLRICELIDRHNMPAGSLVPEALAGAIRDEIDIVDNLPNYQMLAAKPPGEDRRPPSQRGKDGIGFATSKVARCDKYLEQFGDDPDLSRAYRAKRDKELDAKQTLFDPQSMKRAYEVMETSLGEFDRRLAKASQAWLFGAAPTMADLFWVINLARVDNLGAGHFWSDGRLPAVEAFYRRGRQLPAIKAAVLEWPGAVFA